MLPSLQEISAPPPPHSTINGNHNQRTRETSLPTTLGYGSKASSPTVVGSPLGFPHINAQPPLMPPPPYQEFAQIRQQHAPHIPEHHQHQHERAGYSHRGPGLPNHQTNGNGYGLPAPISSIEFHHPGYGATPGHIGYHGSPHHHFGGGQLQRVYGLAGGGFGGGGGFNSMNSSPAGYGGYLGGSSQPGEFDIELPNDDYDMWLMELVGPAASDNGWSNQMLLAQD